MPAAPSLLIVPARFKTGRLYSQIPVPVAPATSGAGDFTVTRATTATRVNSAGLIESVASGIPRLDYFASGGTVGCPALLVEPAGTNLLLQSEAWNVSPWAATSGSNGATVSGNVTASPDGTTNADKLIEAAVTGSHFCLQTLTLTSGTTYTASFFVKASERTRGRLRTSGSGAYWDLDFNLTSGTVTGGTNPFIQNFGNGWYRIGATFTANQASNNFILFLLDASGNASYTGDGTSGLFVYGAQIETGGVATSYIATVASTQTRNADVISVSGAVSGSIGQTEGTIYMEMDVRNLGFGRGFISVQDSSWITNSVRIDSNTANQFRIGIRSAGTQILSQDIASPVFSSGVLKFAMAYSAAVSGVSFAVNGTVIYTSAAALTMPTVLNRVCLGARGDGGTIEFFINDRIRSAALYTTRLTNAELAALTTL